MRSTFVFEVRTDISHKRQLLLEHRIAAHSGVKIGNRKLKNKDYHLKRLKPTHLLYSVANWAARYRHFNFLEIRKVIPRASSNVQRTLGLKEK